MTAPVSRQWCGATGVGGGGAWGGGGSGWGGGGAGWSGGPVSRRPPAAPGRARAVSGSQRSLLSVASDSAASRRPRDRPARAAPPDGGFSLFVSGRFAY